MCDIMQCNVIPVVHYKILMKILLPSILYPSSFIKFVKMFMNLQMFIFLYKFNFNLIPYISVSVFLFYL